MPLMTMVFTDVVESSSTKRDVSFGRDSRERDHAYLEKVQTPHFELVRACCQAHGGREVSTMGDAFFLAFDDPTQAVRCAAQIQKRLTESPIQTPLGPMRLRIGIHSGYPEFFEESWHGTDVDTTARVESAACAQQILLSARTHELTGDMTDAKFRPCGEFALKGVGRVELWELLWDSHGPRHPSALSLEEVRRRTRRRAAALAAAVLIAVGGAYALRRYAKVGNSGFIPATPRPSVAVMEFKNLGKPEVEWLSNAVPEILGTQLGSNDALRVIAADDVSIVKADLAIVPVPTFSLAMVTRIRRILHSSYVVSGAYVAAGSQAGDSIHVDVHVQDSDSGELVGSFAENGTIATLPDVLTTVAAEIRRSVGAQEQSQEQDPKATRLPSNPEALRDYSEGIAKLRIFDALQARELLQRAITLEPNLALLHFGLARSWQLLGYDTNALQEAAKAVELSAGLSTQEQRSIEAEYYELQGTKWDQAIRIYQALWILYPDEPNYALALARAQISDGKGHEALDTLENLRGQPQMKEDPRVDLFVALAAEALSDPKLQENAAAAAAERASKLGSRYLAAQAYWQVCSALAALGELEKASAACQQSASAAPFALQIEARTKTVQANILLAQGHSPEALEMYGQALETARKIGSQKDVIGALVNLANLLDLEGNSKDARQNYAEAIEIARTTGDKQQLSILQLDLGADYYTQGDYAGAGTLYRQSLQNAQETGDTGGIGDAFQRLGLLSLALGDLAGARKNIDEAIKISQTESLQNIQALSLATLGDIELAQADLSGARTNYELSLKLFTSLGDRPGAAGSRISLARLALEEGDARNAEKLASQALEELEGNKLVDNEADARDALSRALMAQGRLAEARTQIDTATSVSPQDRVVLLRVAITDAHLKAREGKPTIALQNLTAHLVTAEKMKLVGSEFEIRLALAELTVNSKSRAVDLQKLEEEATRTGYLLVGHKAAGLKQSLPS